MGRKKKEEVKPEIKAPVVDATDIFDVEPSETTITFPNGSTIVIDSEPKEEEKLKGTVFVGFHPVSGEKVYL